MHHDPRKAATHLGSTVRELREKAEWSQMLLAEKAELSLTYVSQIERSKTGVSLETLMKLGRAFGMSASELLDRAGL